MNRHPAHQTAETVMYAAEELRGYADPGNQFPWELTKDDHRDLLQRLERATMALGDGIRGIAQASGDEYVQQRLTDSYHRLVQASANVGLALSNFDDEPDDEPGEEPENAMQPAEGFGDSHRAETRSAGSAPAPPPTGPSEATARHRQATADSSENSPDTAKGASGPLADPSLDYPNPKGPAITAQRVAPPKAVGQSSLPATRRTL